MQTEAGIMEQNTEEVCRMFSEMPQGSVGSSEGPVLVDLLRDVPCLVSEDPKEMLRFFVHIKSVYDLGLVSDKAFWLRVLTKVRGSLLRFVGEAMRNNESWKNFRIRLLREYFPLFVREKMIREMIVFNLQAKSCPLREFIKQVMDAAEFLQYGASEGELVERILMNLHPDILAQATLLPRPGSFDELRYMVGLIEERMAVRVERGRLESGSRGVQRQDTSRSGSDRQRGTGSSPQGTRGSPKCWKCGKTGHVQRQCRQGNSGAVASVSGVRRQLREQSGHEIVNVSERSIDESTGKGVVPVTDSQYNKGGVKSEDVVDKSTDGKQEGEVMGSLGRRKGQRCLQRQTRKRRSEKFMVKQGENYCNPPLWVKVNFKSTVILGLVDTGAQWTCVRQDVVQSLAKMGTRMKRIPCEMTCHLANGMSCKIKEMVELHFLIGAFSWNFSFKVLSDGPFAIILGLDFLTYSGMVADMTKREYHFGFAPDRVMKFENLNEGIVGRVEGVGTVCEQFVEEASRIAELSSVFVGENPLERVLSEFPGLFTEQLGVVKGAEYEIELVDHVPVRSAPYQCAPPKVKLLREFVNDLLRKGVVRHSKSPYASPAFLLPKSGGGYRLVIDYRKINRKIRFDSYPLPSVEMAFQHFSGATVFSVLDLNMAYFQIPLTPQSRRITAFCTPFGLFEFERLPAGISVGSQGLSRVVDNLFADVKGQYVANYMDDLVLYSKNVVEHEAHLREVLGRLQKAGFTLNREKVVLGASEIRYLGHYVSARGIRAIPERVEVIRGYPTPKNLRSLRRFIGMVGFYAKFIPEFSKKAAPLHKLKGKGVQFKWEEEHQVAFDVLKKALCEAPVLQVPDFEKEFVLVTDASDIAVSAVLNQRVNGELAPVTYHSRLLTSAERRYSTYEKECLAVVFGCERARTYLEHKEFELHCDNMALCWLFKNVKDVGRLGRWIVRLAPFKFKVCHTKGSENVVADALSRMFEGNEREFQEGETVAVLQGLPLVYTSLEEGQKGDPWCSGLVEDLQKGGSAKQRFSLHNNLLCYYPKGARVRRYAVPVLLRQVLVKYFHDSPISGHLGAFKTWKKVGRQFFWPQLKEDVFKYVRECELCQRAKPAQSTKVGLHAATPTTCPLERVFVDFMGPLIRTKKGNQAILVVMDGFTKFVAFYPVRNINSATVCDVLEHKYFASYGVPKSVVTDNAKVFKSKVFFDFCFRWGVKRVNTTPYYPQASLAERVMRNLKAALKIFHHQSQKMWDEKLHMIAFALNSACHESTKMCPARLFLGRELNTPLENVWNLTEVNGGVDEKERIEFWTKAIGNLEMSRSKVAKRYNVDRKEGGFKVGDTVMCKRNVMSSKGKGVSQKLELKWSEPLRIKKFVGPNTVLLLVPETGRVVRKAHVSQLKKYYVRVSK